MNKIRIILFTLLSLSSASLTAQENIVFHSEAVDAFLEWMNNDCTGTDTSKLVSLPASQIMEQIVKSQVKDAPLFSQVLLNFEPGSEDSGSTYLLNKAFHNKEDIENLLGRINDNDFANDIYKRVLAYFPDEYRLKRNYEFFLTLVGWQYGDAITFNYEIQNGKYKIIEEGGIPAIIFNLTLVSELYGNNTEKRIQVLKNIMSHETFHAVLNDYRNENKEWDNSTIENKTLFTMYNEGIAHYIADKNLFGKNLTEEYIKRQNYSFRQLNDSTNIIFNNHYSYNRRLGAMYKGTYGSYWNKYICISGLYMAYHIEHVYGEEGLVKCIENGPLQFFNSYISVTHKDPSLPCLPGKIVEYVKENF